MKEPIDQLRHQPVDQPTHQSTDEPSPPKIPSTKHQYKKLQQAQSYVHAYNFKQFHQHTLFKITCRNDSVT